MSEPCSYCAPEDAEPITSWDDDVSIELDIGGGFAYMNCCCGSHTVALINFCPMCGRKLRGEQE